MMCLIILVLFIALVLLNVHSDVCPHCGGKLKEISPTLFKCDKCGEEFVSL